MGFLLLGLLPTVILVGLFLVYPMIKSAVFLSMIWACCKNPAII